MATDKYPKHKALNPFFDVVMKGLKGLVDGEHYYDAIAEDAQFDFLYRFPGWTEVIHGRDNLISAFSGYGNNIILEKGNGLAVHHDKERGVVTLEYQVHGKAVKTGAAYDNRFVSIVTIRIERLFAGEITWTLLPHGRRSLGNENDNRYSSGGCC